MAEDRAALLRSLQIDRSAPTARRSPSPRWVVVGVVAGVLAGSLGAWFVAGGEKAPAATADAASGQAATAQPAATGTATNAPSARPAPPARAAGLVASGFVVARAKATVAAELTGRITEVLVEEGMAVQAGQVLARLDSTLARIDLDLAKAAVANAEATTASLTADLRDAQVTLERVQRLSKNQNASEAELTRARARAESLRAQIRGAEAQAETARLDVARRLEQLSRYEIKAPFAGVVTDKIGQPGEIISPVSAGGGFTRTGICTLVDMGSLEIEVDVNEAHIGRVSAGQKVEAVLDAYPDWKVPASVIAVVPTANRDKATVRVRVALGVRDPRVLPDMAVKVTFLEGAPGQG
ncbi:MAG TPA: efflux RND transporter periplasmic adaptor subunit [Azospirillaceae bacterium]|nr:efflux RND transporter periplasmic adaptor subunit [Azospirillaceae bacterium]